MTIDASDVDASRATRIAALQATEQAELAAEEENRRKSAKVKGGDGKGEFMREQARVVYGGGGGLEERLKRGRGALVRESD